MFLLYTCTWHVTYTTLNVRTCVQLVTLGSYSASSTSAKINWSANENPTTCLYHIVPRSSYVVATSALQQETSQTQEQIHIETLNQTQLKTTNKLTFCFLLPWAFLPRCHCWFCLGTSPLILISSFIG